MRKVLGLLLLLVAVSGTWAQERRDTLVVSRDGTGDFRTLQEAVESARAFMDYTVTIYVKNGVYKEKVIVPSRLPPLFDFVTLSVLINPPPFLHKSSCRKNPSCK